MPFSLRYTVETMATAAAAAAEAAQAAAAAEDRPQTLLIQSETACVKKCFLCEKDFIPKPKKTTGKRRYPASYKCMKCGCRNIDFCSKECSATRDRWGYTWKMPCKSCLEKYDVNLNPWAVAPKPCEFAKPGKPLGGGINLTCFVCDDSFDRETQPEEHWGYRKCGQCRRIINFCSVACRMDEHNNFLNVQPCKACQSYNAKNDGWRKCFVCEDDYPTNTQLPGINDRCKWCEEETIHMCSMTCRMMHNENVTKSRSCKKCKWFDEA